MNESAFLKSGDELSEIINRITTANGVDPWALRVYGYGRKSRLIAGLTHYWEDVQPEAIERFVTDRNWKLKEMITDGDYTGTTEHRPGFQRLVRLIKSGEVDVVVVHRYDRLFRNVDAFLEFLRLCEKHNVRTLSVTEGFDTDTPFGRFSLLFAAAIAEMFANMASEQTKIAKDVRVKKGLANGNVRFGYCMGTCQTCDHGNGEGYCPNFGAQNVGDGRVPVPHPVDRHAVVLMSELYEKGYSFRQIAEELNENEFMIEEIAKFVQYRSPGSPGKSGPGLIQESLVRETLESRFYIGMVSQFADNLPKSVKESKLHRSTKRKHREAVSEYEGQHEPILSLDQWKRHQVLRKARRNAPSRSDNQTKTYLLKGIAGCWDCSNALGKAVGLRGSNKKYYRCATTQDVGGGKGSKVASGGSLVDSNLRALLEKHHMLRAEPMEDEVAAAVKQLTIPSDWHHRVLAYFMTDDGPAYFEREGYNLHKSLHNHRVLFEEGLIDAAQLRKETARLLKDLEALMPEQMVEGADELLRYLEDFGRIWHAMTDQERSLIVSSLYSAILYDTEGQVREVAVHAPFEGLLPDLLVGD